MEPERLARVALVRLTAKRFGRSVPEEELRWELGVPDATPLLQALERLGLAVRSADGWLPTSPRVESRVREPCASFAWIHA